MREARSNGSYLGHSIVDDLLVCHIALVSHQQLVHSLGSVSVDLLQPLLDVVEGIHVGDIVDDADAVSAAVVGRGDCSEALLPGGIPLLGLDLMLAVLITLQFVASQSCHPARSFEFSNPSARRCKARPLTKSTPMVEM